MEIDQPSSAQSSHKPIFAVLISAVAAFALVQSLTIPALGRLQEQFDVSQSTVTWVLTAYLVAASVATPIVGRLGDRYGKDRMLVFSLIMLALGSLIAAMAPNIAVLIAGRAIQGIGGGILPVSFGIIRDEFPPRHISAAVGFVSSLLAGGIGIGIVLAGPVVTVLGLRWLFWLPAALALASAVAAHFMVPRSPVRSGGPISSASVLLMSTWLVLVLVSISEAPERGWRSPWILGALIGAVVLAAVWVVVESRSSAALVDMKLMRLPSVWPAHMIAFLVGFGLFSTSIFLPQLLQTPVETHYGLGVDVTQTGLLMFPSAIASFVFGAMAAPFAVRYGTKKVIVFAATIAGVSVSTLGIFNGSTWHIALAYTINGVGVGLALACVATTVVSAVPMSQTGVASGMNANIRTIGGSLGAAVLASILAANTDASGLPLEKGYISGFVLVGGLFLVAAILATFLPNAGDREVSRLESARVEAR